MVEITWKGQLNQIDKENDHKDVKHGGKLQNKYLFKTTLMHSKSDSLFYQVIQQYQQQHPCQHRIPDKTNTIANCEYQKKIFVSEMYKQGCQNIISEIDIQFFMKAILSVF